MSQCSGAGFYQQAVDVTVVAAGELDHLVSTGVPPRQPNRTHGRFGPRVDHADFFDRRHRRDHRFGQLGFQDRGCSEAGPTGQGGLESRHDLGMSVSEDVRSPAADVVNQRVAIDIPQPGTLAPVDDQRIAAHGTEGPGRAVDSAGDRLGCPGKMGLAVVSRWAAHAGHARQEELRRARIV